MQPRMLPAVSTVRRRESPVYDDRRRARAIAAGTWRPLGVGVLVSEAEWAGLPPMDRHAIRTREAADAARGKVTLAYAAAAAVWGIDRLGPWPERVDTIVPRLSGGRSSGGFQRHTVVGADPATVPWRGHRLTTPAQTAADLARAAGHFCDAVVAMDQALWARRPGGALATRAQIEAVLDREPGRRGTPRAWRALEFASESADSVRESEARWLLHVLGFPAPVLQRRFVLPGGKDVYSDFYFPAYDHVGEFDGVGKYLDPDLLRGRTPEQALIAEKDRADALRRIVRGMSRWRTPAHRDPRLLYDILTADGLPATRPRPPRGLRFT